MYCPNCFDENFKNNECKKCNYKKTKEDSMLFLKPNTILNNKYLVGRVLGKGGFGITYMGYNKEFNQKVAIKEYLPSNIASRMYDSKNVVIQVDDYKEIYNNNLNKFYDEARILASFSAEGIVKVIDFFHENNTAYMVMYYLEGLTLKDHIKKNGPLSFNEAIKLLIPIINSLIIIHKQRLLHRDISPDNIMILKDNKSVLIDFGAARYSLCNESKSLTIILKPGFAPIEQYTNKSQGPWTDVYALGSTIYYAITKKNPVESLFRLRKDPLAKPTSLVESELINRVQEKILLKSMAVEVKNRYPDIVLFANAINDITNSFIKTLNVNTNLTAKTIKINSEILYDPNKKIEDIKKTSTKLVLIIVLISVSTTISITLFTLNLLNSSEKTDNKNIKKESSTNQNNSTKKPDSNVIIDDNVEIGDNVYIGTDNGSSYIVDYNYNNFEQKRIDKIYKADEKINHDNIIYSIHTLNQVTVDNEIYQLIELTIENKRKKALASSDMTFKLIDSGGNQYENDYLYNYGPSLGCDVAPGNLIRGELAYKLKDNKNLKLDISTVDKIYTVDLNEFPKKSAKIIINTEFGKAFKPGSIEINNVKYSVNSFKVSNEPISFSEKFYTCTLDITVENNSTKGYDIDNTRFCLIDSKYSYHTDNSLELNEQVQPNNKVSGNITFNVPKNESFSFSIFHNSWDSSGKIKILDLF
ncbi:MAG: serine/threonine-protein kinase [Clostridiales bacterium]